MRAIRHDEAGAVYVEFLLAFIPLFFLFLGILQGALLYSANLVVRHAAQRAARAAVVVLPDDPEYYDGQAVNSLEGSGGGSDPMAGLLEWGGLGGGGLGGGSDSGGARVKSIRAAASAPLLAVSPSLSQLIGDPTVYRALGGDPLERAAVGAVTYNRTAMAVTFPSSPGATGFKTTYSNYEDVTVRVTYLFHCGVPLVGRLMCDDVLSLRSGVPLAQLRDLAAKVSSGTASIDELEAAQRRVELAQARLDRAQPGVDELGQAEVPWAIGITALTGARFVVLRAEATLPLQSAGYSFGGGS